MREKARVTAAITGSLHTPTFSPYLPITSQEIADEAARAHDEGVAVAFTEDFVFSNTFKSLKEISAIFNKKGTNPEFEVYDAGMINNVAFMINNGYVKPPVYIQFVMGILGGITATPDNLMFLVNYAKTLIKDFEFSLCVAGRAQFPICTQSLLLGGNVRVGLEDNIYLEKGMMAKSNGEQVAKIVRIAKELGVEAATPEEARQILGVKGLEKVNY